MQEMLPSTYLYADLNNPYIECYRHFKLINFTTFSCSFFLLPLTNFLFSQTCVLKRLISNKPEVPKLVLAAFVAASFCNLVIQTFPSLFPISSFLQMPAPPIPNQHLDAAPQSQNVQRARLAPYNLNNPTITFSDLLQQTDKFTFLTNTCKGQKVAS